jgi:tetratricopeptide (TPR) repeat protein
MAEENDIALIESYLQGELDAKQKNEVEERLGADMAFKELFFDTRIMLEGLGKLRHRTLLNRIDQLEANLGNPLEKKNETKTVFWTIQRVAAAFIGLAIVATVSLYLIRGNTEVTGNELYKEYFIAYENAIVPITRGEDDPTLLVRTFRAYESENYATAITLFDELLKVDEREFISFYGAIAYMGAGDAQKAAGLLKKLVTEKGEFAQQATWYLALNYIKLEDNDNAKSLLITLVENTTYNERAQQLLKRMR